MSGGPSEPWSSTRGESGDDTGIAETEEEQSGLIPLLEQIPLAELREIVRLRGWRVKGTSKADYVPALASLLSDPTETARAVTGLPENLREALRAAFVADDGSGITATIMAQTMSALRSAAGPTIKPVEAAALLSDLAHWGLVVQWRDSLFGEERHVLPWQMQRLIPPLPGWCLPSAEAPTMPAQRRDVRQVVSSLCAAWQRIAARQPAVRAAIPFRREEVAAERLGERRFSSMVQGWPYDPQELRDWAANHRRADRPMQALWVPPTPYLVQDTPQTSLTQATQDDGQNLAAGDDESFEFQCRVLCELGLVSIQSGRLIGQEQEMARFLQLAVSDQHRMIAQAYLSLLDWSELDLMLRQDTRLMLWHKPYFAFPYDQFRSVLLRIRHVLLRFLACAGEDGWCRLSDVEAALRLLWPHFTAPLQSERQPWLSQAWGMAWRSEARLPDTSPAILPSGDTQPDEAGHPGSESVATPLHVDGGAAGWEANQGAFLRAMLEGPLCWLGFAEVSYNGAQLAAFRLHGLANWIWGRPAPRYEVEGEPAAEVLGIGSQGRIISIQPGAISPQAHVLLGRIARLEEASPERFVYRLHAPTALAAFENGASLADLLAEWERVMPQPIPASVRDILSDFWTRYGQVRLYEGFSLLELNDEVTLRELEASTSLSQHIVARVSPRLVLVPDEAVESLMLEFAAKDYMPKELE